MSALIESVGVLPWLSINEPIKVEEVTFFPAAAAVSVLGERSAHLGDRLRIYRDTWDESPVQPTIAIHSRQLSEGGQSPTSVVRRAVDILMTASIFENDGGPTRDVNSTTFTLLFQRLGGAVGFMATQARRRYGGFVAGSTTDLRIARPLYAGSFSSYNREIADALVQASHRNDVGRLFDALAWFRRASTDADNVDNEVDLVLMLTAVDFLLAAPNQQRRSLDQARISQLLSPFEKTQCCSVLGNRESRSHIQAFLFILDQVRNETLHPMSALDRAEHYGFGKADVAFPWLADRCFMALTVARLIELKTLEPSEYFQSFITGVEQWLFDPSDELGKIVLDVKIRRAIANAFVDTYRNEVEVVGLMDDLDERDRTWERNFLLAISPVPKPLRVSLVWLKNGLVSIEIYEKQAEKDRLLDYMLADPEESEPTRMAYAAMSYFGEGRSSGKTAAPTIEFPPSPQEFLGGAREGG